MASYVNFNIERHLFQDKSIGNIQFCLLLMPLKGKHLNVLEWPSQSPAPNPIDNLWYNLKIAVHQQNPSNLMVLEQFCLEEWAKIPVARCAKLIETYPKRLAAVIAAKGGFT